MRPPRILGGLGVLVMLGLLGYNVSLRQSAIRLEVGEKVSVASLSRLNPGAPSLTVLCRPAILETRTGSTTTLTVARDAADRGDFAAIMVLTPDRPADEATMVRLAELVLPHVAGWTV